jgi:D-tagatose-1,6-bisphosphate aldolase subunit GatZ/KbaZ
MMTKALQYLLDLPTRHGRGVHGGITSVCSAHPLTIEVALLEAAANDTFTPI